jgi:hypothetical protein
VTPLALAGGLRLRPGERPSIICERPMVGAALLGRLTEGRRAVLLPELLASVFTLGAPAQRSTSRRAVKAALGRTDSGDDMAAIAFHTAREHLQRFALDLPAHAGPHDAAPPAVTWLRDAPMQPDVGAAPAALDALGGWLHRRLFGMAADQWLARWQREGGDWLSQWCAGRDHPVARWLASVQGAARSIELECRALDVLSSGEAGLRELGAALAADARFAEQPLWRGAPAETGPWTRAGRADAVRTVWDRLGARLADLARIAGGVPLASGALRLGSGIGMAWTEMSRGLLMHWIELETSGAGDAATARAARYRVLAPTEWNFHPDGSFGCGLAAMAFDTAALRLAAAALDPCVAFRVDVDASQHA